MDRTIFDYLMKWLALHQEWQETLTFGANAPRRTDGQMLNGIRNRMIFLLGEAKEDGYSLEDILAEAPVYGCKLSEAVKELPPEMDVKYMKDADAIREKAERALKLYTGSEDYRYIMANMPYLDEEENADILARLKSDTDFVRVLAWMIQKERLPEMRKYSDVLHYLKQLRRARELLEMRIDYIQPFS